ncbi:MAG TPA: BTAD domain-containing putative transcriptional regulator [Gemmatimonadaceae bacterium]|nr:BTAD domain-containing putative transcriptional regulator [Gemmatimonadaceae bacterium]
MLRDNRFRLITLGRLSLVGTGGEEDASLARRRLKLAVLAVLALARRPVPRDTLLGLFWAEHDESRARHSLSNALSSLRGALGERSITTRDADVALDAGAPLAVDALEFSEAIEGRDYARAVDLYAGAFLEGFHVDESPSFDQWASRERRRLESMFLKACAEHCGSLARSRRWPECETIASRWLDAEPLSADAAIYLLNAIKAPGTRSSLARALEEFEALRTRLSHEFDLAPHPSIVELSGRIREQLAAAPPEPVVNIRVTAETKIEPVTAIASAAAVPAASSPAEPVPARLTSEQTPRRVIIRVAAAIAAVAVVALGVSWLANRAEAPETSPVIAVLSLTVRPSDSSTTWLSDGLPQMIDTKLANVSAIDIVPAARVRALMQRSGRTGNAPLLDDVALDLGRRVGATHVAHGSLARDAQNFVLDLSIHDVASGSLVRNVVMTEADPLALADQAAARILAAANVSSGGPRLMDIETGSLEAYQYYMRHLEQAQLGRLTAAVRDLDAAIALDSGFIPALRARLGVGISANDTALTRRLRQLIRRHADRTSQFDRYEQELWDAYYSGEHERSAALARGLVRRYPRDPRGYAMLENILLSLGEFEDAEKVAIAGLSLDSLAMRAGTGPCAQCKGFSSVIHMRWLQGDFDGAAAWSRRWINEQPDASPAWSYLAWSLAYAQKTDSALTLMRRSVTLAGNEMWALDQYARMLIVARRYAAADSVTDRIEALYGDAEGQVADLRALLAREHGRPGEANRLIEDLVARSPLSAYGTDVVRADNRRLMGDVAGAVRIYESISHGGPTPQTSLPLDPGAARAFCWHHALAADALGETGDTVRLRGIADTLEMACHRSYFARDWRLYHHVRGLIAARGGRYAEAEREFTQAVWTRVEGWSRTAVALARAQMALGRPRDAITALRSGYATRLDAMGRYVPISELDYWMAQAFSQAGEADSARRYAGYSEQALKNAEPATKARLSIAVARGPR